MAIAAVALPNPWQRHEMWRKVTEYEKWSNQEGFSILARKAADQEPTIWARVHHNFRSFYTGIGHDRAVFLDPQVKNHLTGAIMCIVRRKHCFVLPKPAHCALALHNSDGRCTRCATGFTTRATSSAPPTLAQAVFRH